MDENSNKVKYTDEVIKSFKTCEILKAHVKLMKIKLIKLF